MTITEELETKNAKIKGTFLGIEDHGFFTAFLTLDYGGVGQGFGGYSFGSNSSSLPAQGDYAGFFIRRTLQVVGASTWEDLRGMHVRVKAKRDKVEAIGNLLEDRWFYPSSEFKENFANPRNP